MQRAICSLVRSSCSPKILISLIAASCLDMDAGAARRKASPRRLDPPFDLVNVQTFRVPASPERARLTARRKSLSHAPSARTCR